VGDVKIVKFMPEIERLESKKIKQENQRSVDEI
jgi:hypothetical protein